MQTVEQRSPAFVSLQCRRLRSFDLKRSENRLATCRNSTEPLEVPTLTRTTTSTLYTLPSYIGHHFRLPEFRHSPPPLKLNSVILLIAHLLTFLIEMFAHVLVNRL
jgi:hypothetical protein